MRTVALLALVLASSTAAAGTIYRCRAEDRQLRFSDHPCAGASEGAYSTPDVHAPTDEDLANERSSRARWLQQREAQRQAARDARGADSASEPSAYAQEEEARRARIRERSIAPLAGRAGRDNEPWKRQPFNPRGEPLSAEEKRALGGSQQPLAVEPGETGPRITRVKTNYSGTGVVRDSGGNTYRYDGLGRPVDRETGQLCQQKGDKIFCSP